MSMPYIEMIKQENAYHPTFKWTLRTVKGQIVYVKYEKNLLTCRYDNYYTGKLLFNKRFVGKQAPSVADTDWMLRETKFKTNHDKWLV